MDAAELHRIVEGLLDDCEAAGFPRHITDPVLLARLSAIFYPRPRG